MAAGRSALNISLQRVDSMSVPLAAGVGLATLGSQSAPYIGAGYSTRINTAAISSPWRFNADLGLISVNQNNVNRISRTLMGEQGFDELVTRSAPASAGESLGGLLVSDPQNNTRLAPGKARQGRA